MNGFNLSRWALEHRSFVWYLMLLFVVSGVWSYLRLGRDEDPPFTVKTMIVATAWPGATIEETILQVTDRIEKKLQETPSLDYLKSYTLSGRSTILVVLKESTPPAMVPDVWDKVRKKLDDIRNTLPQGIQGPFFNDGFGDTFGMIYAFTADGFTARELRDYVEQVRSELLEIPDAAKITLIGTQDERIYLEFDTRQLAGLGIDSNEVVASLRAQNAVEPAGIIRGARESILLRVTGQFLSEESLRNIDLYANGRFYRLRDVATVRRGYADPPQPIFRFNGEPAIGLAVATVKGADILRFGDTLRRRMEEIKADLPIGIEPHLVADQSIVARAAVSRFTEALWEAIAIVLAVSFLTLGLRAGAVVALSIPLVLAIVFLGMALGGISLQRVSLGALVIALGLLVDDAMVTIEMMVSRLERGFDRLAAATHAYSTTAFPMLTGTLVTIAGFIPIGFARSNAGEYCFSLFAVIAIALVVSWLVAVQFTPLLGVMILREPPRPRSGPRPPGRGERAFRTVLLLCMRARYATIAVTLALFALAVVGLRFVQQQFFPASDRPELVVDLSLPQNATITATEAAAETLEKLLAGDPTIDRYSVYVGQGAVRFYLPLNVQMAHDYFAQAVIVTTGLAAREAVRSRLEEAMATALPDIAARIYPLELGPPVGWPLQYRVSGADPQKIRDLAYAVADIVGSNPWTRKIGFDWSEPIKAVHVNVDQDKARRLGISSAALAQAIDATTRGLVITQLRDYVYLVDVIARSGGDERASLDTLRTLQLPIPGGRNLPLLDVASLEYTLEQPLIWRRDRLPTITVQADLSPGIEAKTVTAQLAAKIAAFARTLPAGYRIETGGTADASAKALGSVIAVVPIMVVLMATILMTQLQSFQRLFLVVSVAPLGLIGVVAALLPSHMPLGFIAMLGVIALTGMIIRNSVILIDQIGRNIDTGETHWNAVVNAASHRLRPILLTAAAAMLGMLPIAGEVFWGPMAYAIIGGLASATLLTLLFLPALYVTWYRIAETPTEATTVEASAAAK
jgi:multidrug efflux pump